MNDVIKVDFGAVSGLAQGIDSQVKRVEAILDDLKGQVSNLETIWEGSAGSGFQQVKNNWMTAAGDLNSVLNKIALTVHAAHDSYSSTEATNAAAWG